MISKWTAWTVLILVLWTSLLAFGQDLQLIAELSKATYLLGEPISVSITITNTMEEGWITDELALAMEHVARGTQAERETPEGWILVPVDLLSTTPPPPPFLVVREGELLVAGRSYVLGAAEVFSIALPNLLRYVPIVEPGGYRVNLRLEIPRYRETLDTEGDFIAFSDAEVVDLATTKPSAFRVEVPEGITEEDVARFADLRAIFNTDPAAFLAEAQLLLETSLSEHMQAAALFWAGEMHLRMENPEAAESAFSQILSQYSGSVFAAAASTSLEGIAPSDD
jgi:hypothetical protein